MARLAPMALSLYFVATWQTFLDRRTKLFCKWHCYKQTKRQDHPHELQLARGYLRGETGSTNGRRKRSGERLCTNQAAWSKRCRNRGSLARPNIDRLTNLSF